MTHDVIVIGGSYAGLSAALPLVRARRRVLVIDAGQRRNRFAVHSHGFLTQDGTEAARIAAIGRDQLLAYPTASWREGVAARAEAADGGFRVVMEDGEEATGRRLIVASGVKDHLPDVPGLAERWGRSVFHCPYCHGYELGGGHAGVLASSELSLHHALMLPDWGPTTLLLNGAFVPDADQAAQLDRRGVHVETGLVERIDGAADVVMRDGRILPFAGLFTLTRVAPASPIAAQLGCAMDESPAGTVIRVDAMKATSVPGVFACGDVARAAGSVPLAVGDGAMAGTAAHRSLMIDPF